MCYPKPGPRCSAHAKTKYVALLLKQRALINAGDMTWEQSRKWQADVDTAKLDYDSTPVGQAYLASRIEQGKDYNGEMAEQLENARTLRTMQLKAIKAKDTGDINNHETSDAGWSTDGFLSKDAHRKDWDSEKNQESFKKYMDFSEKFAQKLSTEESMALLWYTDDGASAVNSLIRSQLAKSTGKWTYDNGTNSASGKYAKDMIENHMNTLDNIFYQHELKEPTVLYRGMRDNNLPKEIENASVDSPVFNEFITEKYPVGEEISIPEYMSTSADPAAAHYFTGSQSVILEIETKSAVPVGLVSTYNTSEREFLVNRDGRYRVKSVLKDVTYKNVPHESGPDNDKVTVIQLEEIEAFSLPDLPDFL